MATNERDPRLVEADRLEQMVRIGRVLADARERHAATLRKEIEEERWAPPAPPVSHAGEVLQRVKDRLRTFTPDGLFLASHHLMIIAEEEARRPDPCAVLGSAPEEGDRPDYPSDCPIMGGFDGDEARRTTPPGDDPASRNGTGWAGHKPTGFASAEKWFVE